MEDTVSVEDINQVQKRISIFVSPNSVDKKFNDFFSTIQKDTALNGFRKGKVPLKVLRQQFGNRAKNLVAQNIIEEFYSKALRDHNLNPLNSPSVEDKINSTGKFNSDNSYFISLLIEVLPKFQPEGYKNLELKMPSYDKKAIADAKILEYRKQFAERKQIVDRPAQLGDAVIIDFRGFLDGSPFDGGSAQGYSLDSLGSQKFVAGFEEQIVGMNVGEEKVIDIKFPDNYNVSGLAGKNTKFEVKLHTIVENKMADLNNDLALMTGHSSVEELIEKTNLDTDQFIEKSTRSYLEKQVLSKLLNSNNFEVPKSMVDNEKKRLLGNNNPTEQMLQAVSNSAKINVQRAILLDSVYEAETDIEITPDELDNLLNNYANENNITKDNLVSNLYNSNQMDAFIGILRAKKAMDFIIEKANKVKE